MSIKVIAIHENRRNWQRIIAEIKEGYEHKYGRPLSNWKLGEMVNLDHRSLEILEETPEAQPRHDKGEMLLSLHAEFGVKRV